MTQSVYCSLPAPSKQKVPNSLCLSKKPAAPARTCTTSICCKINHAWSANEKSCEKNWQNISGSCSNTCSKVGLKYGVSSAGQTCASGEKPAYNEDGNKAGNISYKYGKWGGGGRHATKEFGSFCYKKSGDDRDGDGTDRTVACFCE
jgi:hypothetical protein